MKIRFDKNFEDIVRMENLLLAWTEFIRGKRGKRDVQEFSLRLMDNLLILHEDLQRKTYMHGGYEHFRISDPKSRDIHKATVRDRVLHHAIYRILYPFFDRTFITDSFSCRIGKGTHKALNRFRAFGYRVSQNHTRTCWVLKCDIKKFFATIDHEILLDILSSYIPNKDILWLLERVIRSFEIMPGKGLPLGNLTSQLFCNVYMNELDQFVKHKVKAKYYIRYADDFVILSERKDWLESLIPQIGEFLSQKLRLALHPDKIFIKTFASGIDFLGWVHFANHRVLRTATKHRMLKRINTNPTPETLNSYLGLLSHGSTHILIKLINI